MKRAIGQRYEFAIDCKRRERSRNCDRANDAAIDPGLFDRVVLQRRHRAEPFRSRMRRELHLRILR